MRMLRPLPPNSRSLPIPPRRTLLPAPLRSSSSPDPPISSESIRTDEAMVIASLPASQSRQAIEANGTSCHIEPHRADLWTPSSRRPRQPGSLEMRMQLRDKDGGPSIEPAIWQHSVVQMPAAGIAQAHRNSKQAEV